MTAVQLLARLRSSWFQQQRPSLPPSLSCSSSPLVLSSPPSSLCRLNQDSRNLWNRNPSLVLDKHPLKSHLQHLSLGTTSDTGFGRVFHHLRSTSGTGTSGTGTYRTGTSGTNTSGTRTSGTGRVKHPLGTTGSSSPLDILSSPARILLPIDISISITSIGVLVKTVAAVLENLLDIKRC